MWAFNRNKREHSQPCRSIMYISSMLNLFFLRLSSISSTSIQLLISSQIVHDVPLLWVTHSHELYFLTLSGCEDIQSTVNADVHTHTHWVSFPDQWGGWSAMRGHYPRPYAWLGSGIITTKHCDIQWGHMSQTEITDGWADEIPPCV